MPRHQPAGRTAEASVGEQRDRTAEPFTNNRRGYAQHLTHSGTAFRSFVADYHNVACLDFLRRNRGHRIFFRFEDASWPAMLKSFVSTDLGHASLGRKISLENHKP